MENETTFYTSPRTGNRYEVRPVQQSRVDYHVFMDPTSRYIREYTQYNILRDGQRVQFCFSETDVASAVEAYEAPGPDLSSRFD